jgi:hypothetical protein
MEISAAERAILDRISCKAAGFTRLESAVKKIPRDNYRYYLAYCPNGKEAVLRLKDSGGLEDWRRRRWNDRRLMPDPPPTIVDVTSQVLEALERCTTMPRDEFFQSRTWVAVDQGYRFLFTTEDSPPAAGALHISGTGEGPDQALVPAPSVWTALEFRDSENKEAAILRVRTDMLDARLLDDCEAWRSRFLLFHAHRNDVNTLP